MGGKNISFNFFDIDWTFAFFSESVSEELPVWVAFIILCVLFSGILFDIIGTAVNRRSQDPELNVHQTG